MDAPLLDPYTLFLNPFHYSFTFSPLTDLREDVPQQVRDVIALCWAGREARPTMLHVAQVLRAAQ
jgi:hypothetical protein